MSLEALEQLDRFAKREGWVICMVRSSKRHSVTLTLYKDRPTAVLRNRLLSSLCLN